MGVPENAVYESVDGRLKRRRNYPDACGRGFDCFFFLDVPFPVAVIDQKRLTPRAYTHHLEINCREMATMGGGGGGKTIEPV